MHESSEVVAYERISERILAQCLDNMKRLRGRDQFVLYKNNSDGKGNATATTNTTC